jgi:hypothetical protein
MPHGRITLYLTPLELLARLAQRWGGENVFT